MTFEKQETSAENDLFYDAVSTVPFQDADNEDSSNQATNAALVTTSTKQQRTVLTYSDRNGLQMSSQLDATTPIDPNDDFFLSNKLNSITLSNDLELHQYVFHNDLDSINLYIQRYQNKNLSMDFLSIRDIHGNTPLHLAVMLGHTEAAQILVKHGAVVKCRNKQLWTPLNEAISYGDRNLIRSLLIKFEKEVDQILNESKPNILDALQNMIDFYVEVN